MIEKHRAAIRALDDEAISVIAMVMKITEPLLIEGLEARGLCQADVVLGLLHSSDPPARRVVATLTHLHIEPSPHPWPRPYPTLPKTEEHIAWVDKRYRDLPRLGQGCQNGRRQIRVRRGMKLASLVEMGLTRSEVRAAARAGWLKLNTGVI